MAADNAHQAATDDQSVAETQYDTLAIEQSYLAEGQSRRVDEIRNAINILEKLQFDTSFESAKVVLGSLVQTEQDITKKQWFLIAPVAGGKRCQLSYNQDIMNITVITPQSPMGAALLNKTVDDEVIVTVGNNQICDFISEIR